MNTRIDAQRQVALGIPANQVSRIQVVKVHVVGSRGVGVPGAIVVDGNVFGTFFPLKSCAEGRVGVCDGTDALGTLVRVTYLEVDAPLRMEERFYRGTHIETRLELAVGTHESRTVDADFQSCIQVPRVVYARRFLVLHDEALKVVEPFLQCRLRLHTAYCKGSSYKENNNSFHCQFCLLLYGHVDVLMTPIGDKGTKKCVKRGNCHLFF